MSGSVWNSIRRRSRVLAPGVLCGMLFATFVAVKCTGPSFNGFGNIWWLVVAGPVSFLNPVWLSSASACGGVCVIGSFFIPAHPIRPHWFTGLLTTFGLMCWFFLGFIGSLLQYAK